MRHVPSLFLIIGIALQKSHLAPYWANRRTDWNSLSTEDQPCQLLCGGAL